MPIARLGCAAARTTCLTTYRSCLAVVLAAVFAVGCGAEHAKERQAAGLDTLDEFSSTRFDAVQVDERDSIATGECAANASQQCRIYLPEINGVQACFVGTQYCIDGSWSHCLDSELVDENDHDSLLAMDELFAAADQDT